MGIQETRKACHDDPQAAIKRLAVQYLFSGTIELEEYNREFKRAMPDLTESLYVLANMAHLG